MNKDKLNISIRKAIMNDSELLAQVYESNSALYDPIMPGAFTKQAEKFRLKGINTGYDISIIENNVEKLGFLGTLKLNQGKIYLVALYLLEEFQRSGISQKTIDLLVQQSESHDINEIMLLVHSEASWAINFYQKNGFELIATNEQDIKNYDSGILEKLCIGNTYLMTRTIMK